VAYKISKSVSYALYHRVYKSCFFQTAVWFRVDRYVVPGKWSKSNTHHTERGNDTYQAANHIDIRSAEYSWLLIVQLADQWQWNVWFYGHAFAIQVKVVCL